MRVSFSLQELTIILLSVFAFRAPAEAPCTSSVLEEKCLSDDDCTGEGTICVDRICVCHSNYIEFPATKQAPANCQRAPDKVGDQCQKPKSYCKPPLICEGDTQCQCVRGKVRNGSCLVTSKYDDYCDDDYDCTAPFTSCTKSIKRCRCVPGTTFTGSGCIAEQHCPDGAKPGGPCRLHLPSRSEAFDNFANSGSKLDDCDSGLQCITDGASPFGFCCPVSCPLGYAPSKFSCEPDALPENRCPSETHYCNRLVGPSFAVHLCCRSPCSEPNPIYSSGACYERSYLNGVCRVPEQCDGGTTMLCSNAGRCQCRAGFRPQAGGQNDKLTCTKDCGTGILSYEDKCLAAQQPLDQACSLGIQCADPNAVCYGGTCKCKCGFVRVTSGACQDVSQVTTTLAPGATKAPCQGILCLFGNLGSGLGGVTVGR